jgi:hypothetical protein
MRPRSQTLLFLFLLLLLLAAGQATAAQSGAASGPDLHSVRYEIRFMDLHAAEVLAWEQCPAALKDRFRVAVMALPGDPGRKAYLEVNADGPTHEKIARALALADSAPKTQVFQLILLSASNRPDGAAPELPPAAQKALADVRGFLPFKSYEPVDSVWLRTTRQVDGRLVGRNHTSYEVRLRFQSGGADGKDLYVDLFDLREVPDFLEPGSPARTPHQLISTSFSMKQGETIVVGTSKSTDGDEALVVLLTAAP